MINVIQNVANFNENNDSITWNVSQLSILWTNNLLDMNHLKKLYNIFQIQDNILNTLT